MNILVRVILLITLMCNSFTNVQANNIDETAPKAVEPEFSSLEPLHQLAIPISTQPFYEKILKFSEYFIGKPYDYTLGEKLISWDQHRNQLALLNLDTFDCISYVEMVLALSEIDPVPYDNKLFITMLTNNLMQLMFSSKDTNYCTRNHFMDTEWLKSNANIIGINAFANLAYTKHKIALIDKAGLLNTQLHNYAKKYIPQNQHINFFNKYQKPLEIMEPINSAISYITFSDFLTHEKTLTKKLGNKIYLFVMIMDNPKMLELTKSEHNIAHVGFAFIRDNKIYLRHATSIGNQAVEEQLLSAIAVSKQKSNIFPGFTLFEIKNSNQNN
ncbi:hypothetical protein NOVO_05380 [Rickettsiales bacterium Ac37b]|nr:hypothetical protein NOVO_05380 [Rickettsiales bacterium Ac37b]